MVNSINMFDSHVHTKFSTDSRMEIENLMKRADKLNIGVVITEHMDTNYPVPGNFFFNVEDYFEEYSKYRNERLFLGIELGMKMDCVSENRSLIANHPFDYVLGSIHLVDDMDIYSEGFYRNKSKDEAYRRYLEVMLECLKAYDFIDSLGHIDYIARYAHYDDKEIYYEEFSDSIDRVLIEAAYRGMAMEINTRRLHDKGAAENLLRIYKRFYELGGRIVTVGSDAHYTEAVGGSFDIAREIADRSGLRMVYFKERRPQYLK